MTFTTVQLAGSQVLVKGQDNTGTTGQCVLDSSQWDGLKERTAHDKVHAAFNEKVTEFFRPITEAAEEAQAALQVADADEGWFVIEEPTEGQASKPGTRVQLTHDSRVLQLLDNGQGHDRLLWVNDALVIAKENVPFSGAASGAFSAPVGTQTQESGSLD